MVSKGTVAVIEDRPPGGAVGQFKHKIGAGVDKIALQIGRRRIQNNFHGLTFVVHIAFQLYGLPQTGRAVRRVHVHLAVARGGHRVGMESAAGAVSGAGNHGRITLNL